MLIKADPSVPQVSPRRLLRLPHVRTDENYTWSLETEPLRKRIGNLPISHACWRLNTYDLWQKPCIYGMHQKMKKGEMKDDAPPHEALRMHGIYSSFESMLSLERSRVQFSPSLVNFPKSCSCPLAPVGDLDTDRWDTWKYVLFFWCTELLCCGWTIFLSCRLFC